MIRAYCNPAVINELVPGDGLFLFPTPPPTTLQLLQATLCRRRIPGRITSLFNCTISTMGMSICLIYHM